MNYTFAAASSLPMPDPITRGTPLTILGLLKHILNAVSQELSPEITFLCQPILENPSVDETVDDAPTDSDEYCLFSVDI